MNVNGIDGTTKMVSTPVAWLDVLLNAWRSPATREDREAIAAPAFNTKIRNLCLILSVLVIFNHSTSGVWISGSEQQPSVTRSEAGIAVASWETVVQFFLSGSMWRVTNPVFFMASGFLFFFGWRPTLLGLHRKLSKRVFTLFSPYLIWIGLSMSLNFVSYILANFPNFQHEWVAGRISWSQVMTFFLNMPRSGQLWFLHDLLLIMAFAVPVLALVLPRLRGWTIPLFLALYFSDIPNPGVGRPGLCFFAIGATLGYLRLQPKFPSLVWRRIAVMAWVGTAGAYTILSLLTDWQLKPLFNLLVLVGIVGVWAFYDLLPARMHNWLTGLSPYRFFIYMMFDPLLPILQRVIAPWLAPTPLIQLLCYFVMPLIVIALCVGIAGSLRQRLPRGYAVLTGGR